MNNNDTGGNGDDSRIQLRVMGLSYTQIRSGAYALLLAQVDGPVKIPIVIGDSEARSIALRMENLTPPRPMTHDLFVSFAHAFGVRLDEVFIYKFEDGVFSSELTFSDNTGRTIKIDSRTSDAIAIAMRTRSPIFTTREILHKTGFVMEIHNTPASTASQSEPQPDELTIEQLEARLTECVDNERYEEAARLAEIINRRKNNGDHKDDSTEFC